VCRCRIHFLYSFFVFVGWQEVIVIMVIVVVFRVEEDGGACT